MNTTKRTRRKFTDQQKQDIVDEADQNKASGGNFKEVLSTHGLTSSTLSKWRRELSGKKPSRNASKASKRKIASKLTLQDVINELSDLEKEMDVLEQRMAEIKDMKVSDLI